MMAQTNAQPQKRRSLMRALRNGAEHREARNACGRIVSKRSSRSPALRTSRATLAAIGTDKFTDEGTRNDD